ncbi:MAG: helix-turn-helix transcriptional regulator [Bacteroidales bacterium]|nr:helix-turn-helix transcriptional regulator [Bacteroidales bacterium]
MEITRHQYEFALNRIEELLPVVDDSTLPSDRNAVELSLLSDVVIEYENIHYEIEKPTIAELIDLALEEHKMTQKELAKEIGVSPSRINDFISGRAEPSLKIAKRLCLTLGITASAMLGV